MGPGASDFAVRSMTEFSGTGAHSAVWVEVTWWREGRWRMRTDKEASDANDWHACRHLPQLRLLGTGFQLTVKPSLHGPRT